PPAQSAVFVFTRQQGGLVFGQFQEALQYRVQEKGIRIVGAAVMVGCQIIGGQVPARLTQERSIRVEKRSGRKLAAAQPGVADGQRVFDQVGPRRQRHLIEHLPQE